MASTVPGRGVSDFTTSTPEVHRMVHACAAHLSDEEWATLGVWAASETREIGWTPPPYRTIRHPYGFLIDTFSEEEEHREGARDDGMATGFFAVLDYARAHGHRWINFDPDYEFIEGLPAQEHLI